MKKQSQIYEIKQSFGKLLHRNAIISFGLISLKKCVVLIHNAVPGEKIYNAVGGQGVADLKIAHRGGSLLAKGSLGRMSSWTTFIP